MHERRPLDLRVCGDLAPLRRALEDNGFVRAALAETLDTGAARGALATPEDVEVVLRRTAGGSPYEALVRLFALARAVPEDAARAALAPAELEWLAAIGLLRTCEGGVRAEVALTPVGDLYVVQDFSPQVAGRPSARDQVATVSPASLTLGDLTVRRQGETALDLGTGSGIQALWAARHARHVVATDTSPRALNLAAFAARLNGLPNVEVRQGSLFQPVAQDRFELIVANPPFIIAPRVEHEYRDSAFPGDAISERVLREAPGVLSEGGYCTILFNWGHRDESDWAERPKQWAGGSGCDAWLIRSATADPLTYASRLLAQEGPAEAGRFGGLLDEWVRHIEGLGFGAVSWGVALLRRRAAPANWVRADTLPLDLLRGPCGGQAQRIFAAQDLLAQASDAEQLLDHALVLGPDHELQQSLQMDKESWVVRGAVLRQSEGFGFSGSVDRLVVTALAGCDGRRTLREVAAALASGMRLQFAEAAQRCAAAARRLLAWGFLVPAPRSSALVPDPAPRVPTGPSVNT